MPSSPGPLPVPAWNTAQPLAPHSLCSAPGRGGAGLDLWMRRLGPTNWGHRYAGTPARGLPGSRALLVCDSTGQRPPNRPPGWRQQTGGRTELGRVGWTVPKTKANCSAPPHLPSPARQPASHCTGPGRPSRGGGPDELMGAGRPKPRPRAPLFPRSRVVPETAVRRTRQ